MIFTVGFTTKKKAKDATQMVIEPSDELYTDNVVSPIPTVDEENENMYDDNVVEQTYDDTQAPGDDGETYEELECVGMVWQLFPCYSNIFLTCDFFFIFFAW